MSQISRLGRDPQPRLCVERRTPSSRHPEYTIGLVAFHAEFAGADPNSSGQREETARGQVTWTRSGASPWWIAVLDGRWGASMGTPQCRYRRTPILKRMV